MTAEPTLVFILGYPRSGSTILSNVLGELAGWAHGGELRYLWARILLGSRPTRCGCGEPFECCALWSDVLASAHLPDPNVVLHGQERSAGSRNLPSLLRKHPRISRSLGAYMDAIGRLYGAYCAVSGAQVLVDSSKLPGDAAIAALLPGFRTVLVHLVRDPRGVVRSRQGRGRALRTDGTVESDRRIIAYDAAGWSAVNLVSEAVCARRARGRSLFVRYESFVREPSVCIRRIVAATGVDVPLPFTGDRSLELGRHHTIFGNIARFRTGPVELVSDDRWVTELSPADRRIVDALTLPVRRRYGYGPGVRHRPDAAATA